MSNPNRPWPTLERPGGCVECGTTERAHKGKGLCVTCYARDQYRRSVGKSPKTEPEVEPVAPVEDFNPFASDLEAMFPSGEVRPGQSPSPGSPSDGVIPAGVESLPRDPVSPLKRLLGKKEPKVTVTPPSAPKTTEKRPGAFSKKRRSVAGDLEQLFGSIGARLARMTADGVPMGKHYSLGQYLQWNAPASAEVIDDALKDTIIDRKVFQPLSAGKDKIGALGGVVGPPLFIFAIETNPNLFPALYPALYMAIEASLDSLLPAKKRAEQRAKKRADAIREAFGDEVPPGTDPVAGMIESLFPWAFVPGQPEPQSEGVVHENAQ